MNLIKLTLRFGNKLLFLDIFTNCPCLEQLHINSLTCDTQKLCRDLEKSFFRAKRLRTLKVFQSQWTQFSPNLLQSLAENCNNLDQVVLVDNSKAFTLKKFPVDKLLLVAKKKSMRFLYITSELLNQDNIQKLKSEVRKICKLKPYLICRFVKEFVQGKRAFYHLEDVCNLPMDYFKAVTSINSIAGSYHSNSVVGNINLENVF